MECLSITSNIWYLMIYIVGVVCPDGRRRCRSGISSSWPPWGARRSGPPHRVRACRFDRQAHSVGRVPPEPHWLPQRAHRQDRAGACWVHPARRPPCTDRPPCANRPPCAGRAPRTDRPWTASGLLVAHPQLAPLVVNGLNPCLNK